MKNLPVYENLDTSFVNLSALIRFLRERNFAGNLTLRLSGYDADIAFDGNGRMTAREHDRIAGRIAEGDEAFQRVLIRARESGGKIQVFQTVEETESFERETQPVTENYNKKHADAPREVFKKPTVIEQPVLKNQEEDLFLDEKEKSEPLPLEFSNQVEERARQTQATTAEEWQTLLQLTSELLGTIDKTLAAAGLDFQAAFSKARAEIADDYPFLKSSTGEFSYSNGKITLRDESVNAKIFAAGINEALRRILDKLDSNQKFEEVFRQVAQAILALIHRHKPLYDKFFITPQLEKSLGV